MSLVKHLGAFCCGSQMWKKREHWPSPDFCAAEMVELRSRPASTGIKRQIDKPCPLRQTPVPSLFT